MLGGVDMPHPNPIFQGASAFTESIFWRLTWKCNLIPPGAGSPHMIFS